MTFRDDSQPDVGAPEAAAQADPKAVEFDNLRPILARVCRTHCWIMRPNKIPRHIDAPLTDARVSAHLNGEAAAGACPISPGTSTTRLGLLDFDAHKGETSWPAMQAAAAEVMRVLNAQGCAPQAFRSSGGRGIHAVLLWNEEQDAHSVRRMLTQALGSAGLKNGTQGVAAGEVEIFPKQDAVPADGCGNMFVLPFAGKSKALDPETLEDLPDDAALDWRESVAVPVVAPPQRKQSTPSEVPPDRKRLAAALDAIPNNDRDYDSWRNIIFAIHHASGGSDEGLILAHKFSAKSPKYNPDFLDKSVWPYIKTSREGAITSATLYAEAKRHGWQDVDAEDFRDLSEKPSASHPFRVQTASEFASRAPPESIIDDVLPDADLGVIYGDTGSGKTFFALDLVLHVARGERWLDRHVRQGSVVYICAEGAGGFRSRLAAVQRHHSLDLDTLPFGVVADAPNFIADCQDVTNLINAIKVFGSCDLVVIDTLAQVTPGANENAADDMGAVLKKCRRIRAETGAMVLLIHHAGKDLSRGARGWSGLKAAADVEIEITRNGAERCAKVTKLKDGKDGQRFGFKLVPIVLGLDPRGEAISSCVVELSEVPTHEAPTHRATRRRPPGANAILALKVVQDLAAVAPVPVADVVDAMIPRMIARPDARGKDRRRDLARSAISSLQAGGWVTLHNDTVSLTGVENGGLESSGAAQFGPVPAHELAQKWDSTGGPVAQPSPVTP